MYNDQDEYVDLLLSLRPYTFLSTPALLPSVSSLALLLGFYLLHFLQVLAVSIYFLAKLTYFPALCYFWL